MNAYKFKIYMERELIAQGSTAEEARQNLIEDMASRSRDDVFEPNGSDYIDDGVLLEKEREL